jgi:multiple sugar transport system substrate-binding protein
MGRVRTLTRAASAALATAALCGLVGGCSSAGAGAGAQNGPYTVWDPYPQLGASSPWSELLTRCANENGASIRRTSYATAALPDRTAAAAGQGLSPDLLVAADQDLPTLVGQHLLAPDAATGLNPSGVVPGVRGAAAVSGIGYGLPLGVNTVALYYDKPVLAAAGVSPASITGWSSLTAALAKVKAAGRTGITFAADDGADAAFSFEPWLWGAGGSLAAPVSPAAAAALGLWAGWVREGYAPASVAADSLAASWTRFAAGGTAFAEGDVADATAAGKLGFSHGVIAIPAQNGGSPAPVPVSGESFTIPVQQDTRRYAIDDKIVGCLESGTNGAAIDGGLSYLGASSAVQATQLKQTPSLQPWTAVLQDAKAPADDGVGVRYRTIAQELGAAARSALDGSATPGVALSRVR